jgi:hypothetical protein
MSLTADDVRLSFLTMRAFPRGITKDCVDGLTRMEAFQKQQTPIPNRGTGKYAGMRLDPGVNNGYHCRKTRSKHLHHQLYELQCQINNMSFEQSVTTESKC